MWQGDGLLSRELEWVDEIRYLGVYTVKFQCSFDNAKRSFDSAAIVFLQIAGRVAAEEVIVQLLKQKSFACALEVCNLDKKSMNSLDFALNKFFIKLFKTSDMEIVKLSEFFWLWIT